MQRMRVGVVAFATCVARRRVGALWCGGVTATAAMHTSSSSSTTTTTAATSPSSPATARTRAGRRGGKRQHTQSSSKLRVVASSHGESQQQQQSSSTTPASDTAATLLSNSNKRNEMAAPATTTAATAAVCVSDDKDTAVAQPPRQRAWRRSGARHGDSNNNDTNSAVGERTAASLAQALQQHVCARSDDATSNTATTASNDNDSNTCEEDEHAGDAAAAAERQRRHRRRRHSMLRRVVDALCNTATRVTSAAAQWRAHAADDEVRALERRLEAALRVNTVDAYAALADTLQQRYRSEAALRQPHSVALLVLYARTLASYGAFCLVNFATQRAVLLLQEAIRLTHEAYALHTSSSSLSTEGALVVPWQTTRVRSCDEAAAAVVHLRVLLANALAAEQQHWRAAQQYELALYTLQRHPCTAPLQLSPGVVAWQPLYEAFVHDDAAAFARDAAQVQQALTQGKAHVLLLQSQGADARRMAAAQLSLARLYRVSSEGVCRSSNNDSSNSSSNRPRTAARDDKSKSSEEAATTASAARHRAEAQRWYEMYLDGLVARGDEDEHDVMLELGRLLCFPASEDTSTTTTTTAAAADCETGLVYLESASELAREEAEATLQAWQRTRTATAAATATASARAATDAHNDDDNDGAAHSGSDASGHAMVTVAHTRVPVAVVCSVVRAAAALIDTAAVLCVQEQSNRALTLYDAAIALLTRASLETMACWALVQHAELLCRFGFVDRGLDGHLRAMRVLRMAQQRRAVPLQLTTRQRLRPFTAAAAEAHLAHCVQVYVGDYRRAAHHYQRVCACVVGGAQGQTREQQQQRRGCRHDGSSGNAHEHVDGDGADAYALEPDTLHWALGHYVACCERLQRWQAAVVAQTRLVEVEVGLGVDAVPSYLKLADLFRQQGNLERQLALYFFLFFLPDDALSPATRVRVAHGFAKCCYLLDNHRMGAVLLHAVQYVRRDYDVQVLVDYAMCLRSLRAATTMPTNTAAAGERAVCEGGDAVVEGSEDDDDAACTSVSHIARVFRRAARLIVAQRVIDEADAKAGAGGSKTRASTTAAARVSNELSSLIALSRGAFFFHQHGMRREAEELYACALALADDAGIDESASATYAHELAILLTNYATLKASTPSTTPAVAAATTTTAITTTATSLPATTTASTSNRDSAEALYARAAALSPRHLDVAEVIVDYYTQTGNYAAGAPYIRRVCAAHPAAAPRMQLQLARLATGHAWDGLSPAQRIEALECLVCSLGVPACQLPVYTTPTTPANIDARVDALAPLLLDGVASTTSGDVACLVNYVVQTRLRRPRTLNKLYRAALRKFPYNTALLVNYATFCADHHHTCLARLYYAKAYGVADGDFSRTQCYANFLSSTFHDEPQPTATTTTTASSSLSSSSTTTSSSNNKDSTTTSPSPSSTSSSSSSSVAYSHYASSQVGCGEVLYRDFVERHPRSALAHTHYANYLAVALPTPFVAEAHFEHALRLDRQSSNTYQLYAHFVWACADSRAAYADAAVQASVFDRAEELMQRAVACDPHSVSSLLHLGTFYANRRNRFHDAMTTLYRAHTLSPHNVDVVRQMCAVLLVECARTHEAEQRRLRAAAKQSSSSRSLTSDKQRGGDDGSAVTAHSRRLRALIDAAHKAFDRAVQLDPHHRTTLERYAGFAVTMLRDHVLAAELYRRLQRLDQQE